MDLEELKQKNDSIDKQIGEINKQRFELERKKDENRRAYFEEHKPNTFRLFERIAVRARVTQEHFDLMSYKDQKKKKNQVGSIYTKKGLFGEWHLEKNGDIVPLLINGNFHYADEFVDAKSIEQIDGQCGYCNYYKEGHCYRCGGMEDGPKFAVREVDEDGFTCPEYLEFIGHYYDCWGKKYHVEYAPHKKEYHIHDTLGDKYNLWFTVCKEEDFDRIYFENNPNDNGKETDDNV